jgi:hypothetical protein
MAADPDVSYQAAAIAILGVYTGSCFGRQSSAACAKVYDEATEKNTIHVTLTMSFSQ